MNQTTATMMKRMMATDPEWAPTLMKRSDIDFSDIEDDPEPAPPREPIIYEKEERAPFPKIVITVCPKCGLKTHYNERCGVPYCE